VQRAAGWLTVLHAPKACQQIEPQGDKARSEKGTIEKSEGNAEWKAGKK